MTKEMHLPHFWGKNCVWWAWWAQMCLPHVKIRVPMPAQATRVVHPIPPHISYMDAFLHINSNYIRGGSLKAQNRVFFCMIPEYIAPSCLLSGSALKCIHSCGAWKLPARGNMPINGRSMNYIWTIYSATPDHWLNQFGPKLIDWTSLQNKHRCNNKGEERWNGNFSRFPLKSHQPRVWLPKVAQTLATLQPGHF